MFVNLLPHKTRLKIQYRTLLRHYFKVWSFAGAVAICFVAVEFWSLIKAHEQVSLLTIESQPLFLLQEELDESQQRIQAMQADYQKLEKLQSPDHVIDLLGILVKETRSEPGKLQIQCLNLQKGQRPVTTPHTAAAAIPVNGRGFPIDTLVLHGVAEDDGALSRFVTGLREAGVFESVDLKSSTQVQGGKRTARQYQLECRYEDKP